MHTNDLTSLFKIILDTVSTKKNHIEPVKVIFNDKATIVYWTDNTKTVVKCQDGDTYSKETGFAIACAKKLMGNEGNFNEVLKKYCY